MKRTTLRRSTLLSKSAQATCDAELFQSLPDERAHGLLAAGRVGRGFRSERKVVAFQFVTSNLICAGTRLVPGYIHMVGDGFGFAVDRICPCIREHALDEGFCFIRCSNCTCRFLTVTGNNHHDHASVAAIVDVTRWVGSHDVGSRARWKFLADVGKQLPGSQNCLLDGVRWPGLR